MAVRDALPLALPKDVAEAAAKAQETAAGQGAAESEKQLPAMPERGPEITELR